MGKDRERSLDTPERVFNYSMSSGRDSVDHHDYGNGIKFYKQALEVHPSNKQARYLLAFCYSKTGQNWDALRELNTLLRLPKPNPIWAVAQSRILAELGLDEDSLKALERMSPSDRAHSIVQHEIFNANRRLGRTGAACVAMARDKIYKAVEGLRRH